MAKNSTMVHINVGGGEQPRYLHEIMMLDPSGFVLPIVTQTSPDVHPTHNEYGRAIVEEKRAQGWLFWDSCPAGTGAVSDSDPCPPGSAMPCPHLMRHKATRVRDHEIESADRAAQLLSNAERQLLHTAAQREDSAKALANSERRHAEAMEQNQALLAQLTAAVQTLAGNAAKPARKPKPNE